MTKSFKPPRVEVWKAKDLTKASTNVRQEYPDVALEALSDSISQMGLLELPKATPKGEVFAGWGRVEACILQGGVDAEGKPEDVELPVVIIENLSEKEQILMSISENEARTSLYNYELGDAIATLKATHGMNNLEIAKATGIGYTKITALLSIDKMPEKVREQMGDMPGYTAFKVALIAGESGGDEEVAQKSVDLAKTVTPSGKKVTKETLDSILEFSKQASGDSVVVKSALNRAIEAAKVTDYRTLSISFPEDLWKVCYRYSLYKKWTVQEVIISVVKGQSQKLQKEISGK